MPPPSLNHIHLCIHFISQPYCRWTSITITTDSSKTFSDFPLPNGTDSPDWLSRLPTDQTLISNPLSPKKQPSLTGFFRTRSTSCSWPAPRLGHHIPENESHSSVWLHLSLQPNTHPQPPVHNPFSLCWPLCSSTPSTVVGPWFCSRQSCRPLYFHEGVWSVIPRPLLVGEDYFTLMCFCWQRPDASHIQLNVRCASHSALTKGVNSETSKRLSFV